jgi:transcriptional regulator with XRE-family HTH domain
VQEDSLSKKIGATVRRLRQARGLSQEAFADHCGLHRTYIGAIERGEKTISVETANKLAQAFSLSLQDFFGQVEQY